MLAVVINLTYACNGDKEGTPVSFSILKSGDYCSVKDQSVVRITNENDLSLLWGQMNSLQTPIPSIPQVDFNKDMCLFIFLGSRPTAGYSIELTQVVETDTNIRVRIKEVVPTDFVAQVVTNPYLVVTLANNAKPIESVFTKFW